MSVKIRLARGGRKKRPFYRIVVANSEAPRDGRFIEKIGTYNPLPLSAEVQIDPERLQYWLQQGAKPTDTVRNLIEKHGTQAGS
jgi:small subunit ribosomal protein S16